VMLVLGTSLPASLDMPHEHNAKDAAFTVALREEIEACASVPS
jgi:hypothetical protein